MQVSFCNEFQEELNFGLSNRKNCFAQVYFALKGVTLGYFVQVDVFNLHSLHGTLEKNVNEEIFHFALSGKVNIQHSH